VQIISSYFWYFEYICNTNIVFHSRETWKSLYFNKKFFYCPGRGLDPLPPPLSTPVSIWQNYGYEFVASLFRPTRCIIIGSRLDASPMLAGSLQCSWSKMQWRVGLWTKADSKTSSLWRHCDVTYDVGQIARPRETAVGFWTRDY